MRTAIIDEVYKIMKENKDSYFLTGDLGYNTLEGIEKEFGSRFINVGVAEQNMIGIASGLALTGKKVFVYSIIPFLIMRCFEQIINDMCYHDLDVTLLGSGSGITYGILSSTHFALEDVAILRNLPNMTIFSPCDETEAIIGMKALKNHHHPTYVRIGARTENTVYEKPFNFILGKGNIFKKGKDVAVFVSGSLISEVIKAVDQIEKETGKSIAIIDIHTIKPIDRELIISESRNKKIVFTVEEHGKIGGMGSAVSEIVSEFCPGTKVIRIGTDDKFIKIVGTRSFLRKHLGFNSEGITKKILGFL